VARANSFARVLNAIKMTPEDTGKTSLPVPPKISVVFSEFTILRSTE